MERLSKKKHIQPPQIYQLLPRTNCKLCGCASCFEFAFDLIARKKKPLDCPDLQTEAFFTVFRQLNEELGGGEHIEGTDFIIDRDKCDGCGDCIVMCGRGRKKVIYEEEVPPVLQVVDGSIQVINWSSCRRSEGASALCKVCEQTCPSGAIVLVK